MTMKMVDQQQRDLRGVVQEEVDRLGDAVRGVHAQRPVQQPVPQMLVEDVQPHPRERRAHERDDLATARWSGCDR